MGIDQGFHPMQVVPDALLDFLDTLDALRLKARAYGLWQTAEQCQATLDQARAEIPVALPRVPVRMVLTFGPVREQSTRVK